MVISSKKSHFLFIKNKLFYFNPSAENKLLEIKGIFSVDKQNNLVYLVTEPLAWRRQYKFPEKIQFKGKWQLTPEHDLLLTLEDKRQFDKSQLLLKGTIKKHTINQLIFQLKSDTQGFNKLAFLKFQGFWQANKYNQIVFAIIKKDSPDILTFQGDWKLDKNQQLTYTYQKTNLKTKTTRISTLKFKGFWQINQKNHLKYILSAKQNAFFDFRVNIESPSLYPKKGAIKYRVGIGVKKGIGRGKESIYYREKVISLFGEWKFSRRWGLSFESDYGGGRIKKICLSAQVNINDGKSIIFTLLGQDNQPIGASVIFKQKMLSKNDFEYFLRLKTKGKNHQISAGLTFKF